jgi:hypothetical protein
MGLSTLTSRGTSSPIVTRILPELERDARMLHQMTLRIVTAACEFCFTSTHLPVGLAEVGLSEEEEERRVEGQVEEGEGEEVRRRGVGAWAGGAARWFEVIVPGSQLELHWPVLPELPRLWSA